MRFHESPIIFEDWWLNVIADQCFGGAKGAPSTVSAWVVDEIDYRLIVIASQSDDLPAGPIQLQEIIDHTLRLRAAIDVVAQEYERISASRVTGMRSNLYQQAFQQIQATMDVPDRIDAGPVWNLCR